MSVTSEIMAAFDAVKNVAAASEYADNHALGVWTDDPADPGVTAVVMNGALYSLSFPTPT